MHFTVRESDDESKVWELVIKNLDPSTVEKVSASSSSFYRTADGIECSIRKANGDLIATGYSESDRMGNRRWSFNLS
tara:strand:- start:2100 stop:2330 length:231 start_codon:yes stop_codon:yes gene_type:complete